jgi:hypothetical protein
LGHHFPSVVKYREELTNSYVNRAIGQTATGQLAAALQAIRRARALAEQLRAEHPDNRRYRELSALAAAAEPSILAKQGDYRQAAAVAGKVAQRPALDDLTRYNLACAWSLTCEAVARDPHLTAAERQRLTDAYAAQALNLLARARDNGMFGAKGNLDALKTDEDLNALRKRSDFRKFLEDVEKAQTGGRSSP